MQDQAQKDTVGIWAEITDPLTEAVVFRDTQILSMVRTAVEEKQVMLAYQPIVQTRDSARVAFYEGLIRVMDGSGRVLPARDFIDAVETDELGRQLDCQALEMGLATLAEQSDIRLAINMSARSIAYPHWHRILNRGLKADPTIAERLILEITERSAMVMPDAVKVFMSRLQRQGVSFALDDFGSGYTAFRYFKTFNFDILKIDGQFIRGIASDPDSQVLTQALMSIAEHFDMFTVAECVENEDDADFLIDAGIDCLQGYFYGAPTIHPIWTQDFGAGRKVG